MDKKNSELPKTRIATSDFQKIKEAILKMNENTFNIKVSLPDFQRLAVVEFAKKVLAEEFEFKIK